VLPDRPSSPAGNTSNWEHEIRVREDEARVAFLAADIQTLDEIFAHDFVVNSPLQQVVLKTRLLELLRTGRIRHSSYEVEIEHLSRQGDIVVVMGRDVVVDPPDNARSRRRFTNIWRLEEGVWRMSARHAHVVSREIATG
jgi:hypothetical protein